MSLKLDYNYTATYEDGTQIHFDCNDPDGDKCLTRTDGTGSRFTDVLAKAEESKLICFVLHNDTNSVGVDLVDGHFEFDGKPFLQHRPDLDGYKDFRIIYHRTIQRFIDQASGEEINANVTGYTVGWQVTHNGQNVQRTVTVW